MPVEPDGGRPAGDTIRPVSRQATVSEFDPDTGAGAVLDDNGRRAEFAGSAFRAGGLRLLRLGQRVRLDYFPDDRADDGGIGQIRRITLITLP